MLRIFTPVKIQRLLPGLNPQTWVPQASMLTTRPPKPSNYKQKFKRNTNRAVENNFEFNTRTDFNSPRRKFS